MKQHRNHIKTDTMMEVTTPINYDELRLVECPWCSMTMPRGEFRKHVLPCMDESNRNWVEMMKSRFPEQTKDWK